MGVFIDCFNTIVQKRNKISLNRCKRFIVDTIKKKNKKEQTALLNTRVIRCVSLYYNFTSVSLRFALVNFELAVV